MSSSRMAPQQNLLSPVSTSTFQRAYQACANCRRRKAKCIVANDESSCMKCRRERRNCVFNSERRSHTAAQRTEGSSASVLEDIQTSVSQTNISEENETSHVLPSLMYNGVPQTPEESSAPYLILDGYAEKWTTVRHALSNPAQSTLDVWKSYRFVKSGWFTAQEAVTYVDLFFQNMSILSPVLSDYYRDHSNHQALITEEPTLCSTIIALSSRYHLLAGGCGLSRGFYIHDRMWKYCRSLLDQVIWNQRRIVIDETKGLGTIESFLLITEWLPRSVHIPEDSDYGESEAVSHENELNQETGKVPNKWLQEITELTQKTDRMSWMLLGGALALAHELDLFDDSYRSSAITANGANSNQKSALGQLRRNRLRRLLFVYICTVASRIGCSMPKTPFHTTINTIISGSDLARDHQWHNHMAHWVELTRLVRTTSEFLFPSKEVTKDLLRSGRYTDFLDHFKPLLDQWLEKFSQAPDMEVYHKLLLIDYHVVRMNVNSLTLQAIAGRFIENRNLGAGPQIEESEYSCIREVIGSCRDILEIVIKLSISGNLKYIPVRLYIRIASASIYLINALALGVRREELDSSLRLLDNSVQALRTDAVDDMHLSVRFASIIETHIKDLRQRFVRVSNPIFSAGYAPYQPEITTQEATQLLDNFTSNYALTTRSRNADIIPLERIRGENFNPTTTFGDYGGNSGLYSNLYSQDGVVVAGDHSAQDWLAMDFADAAFDDELLQTMFAFDMSGASVF